MKKAFFATVHILVDADNEGEAAGAVSSLLTEVGIYEGDRPTLIDWAYLYENGKWVHPQEVEVPDDYDRDEDSLAALKPNT